MKNGWNNPKPDKEVAEYLEGGGGRTEKPELEKKYGSGAANPWSPKPDANVRNYLETGKSGASDEQKKRKKAKTNAAVNPWGTKPSDDVLKYLGGGASGKIGERLAQAQAEPDIEDYLETFEKWNGKEYANDRQAYGCVGEFKPLPATVEDVQEFLDKSRADRAGLFASYCLNEIRKGEIELRLERPHNYIGAYNDGKTWRIYGNVGDKSGIGMVDGELIVDGSAGNRFCEEMSGGKAVLYRNAGDFAGAGMKGGELRVNGSARDYAGYKMRGGTITVQRNAGEAPGDEMEDGKVVIGGDAGLDAGKRMKGGKLVVMGGAGERAGIGMKGGILTIEGDVDDRAAGAMEGGELRINGKLSKGWTYELAYGITGGNIFHKGRQLYKDGRKVRRWLIF